MSVSAESEKKEKPCAYSESDVSNLLQKGQLQLVTFSGRGEFWKHVKKIVEKKDGNDVFVNFVKCIHCNALLSYEGCVSNLCIK